MSLPDFGAKILLEATISPSEDPGKVAEALAGVLGEAAELADTGPASARLTIGNPQALARVRDQLRDRHVRSAARRQLLLNKSGTSTRLMLNRQAAAAGVLALCGSDEESPLGPIYMTIESDRLDEVIDWVTAYDGG